MIVCQLDPGREAAWKKLGYFRQKGKWTTAAKVAAERAEADAQRKADAHWRPLIQTWKAGLARKDKRAESERALAAVIDPRAVPSIWKAFAAGSSDDQEMAIDILGHIDGERPSRALAGLAILGKTDVIRRAATETLARRNHMGILIDWIGLLHDPIKYEVKQVAGPGMPGTLLVEGEEFNVRRFIYAPDRLADRSGDLRAHTRWLSPPAEDRLAASLAAQARGKTSRGPRWRRCSSFTTTRGHPKDPRRNTMTRHASYQSYERNLLQAQINAEFQLQEANKVAAGAQAQLANDVNVIEAINGTIRERNARLAEALRRVSGKDLGEDREAWLKWWLESRGYKYIAPKDRDKATVDMQVALPYFPTLWAGPGHEWQWRQQPRVLHHL